MRSDLVFKTRGDAQTASSDPARARSPPCWDERRGARRLHRQPAQLADAPDACGTVGLVALEGPAQAPAEVSGGRRVVAEAHLPAAVGLQECYSRPKAAFVIYSSNLQYLN